MNKQFKFFIACAAIVAGLASAVSCQDLTKDLEKLDNRIDNLESRVTTLENEIKQGAVITNVAKGSDGGIVVTLSNGNTYTIPAGTNGTNGKDGKDGKDGKNGTNGTNGKDADVWTIGNDGFWYKNGEKTEYQAVGKDGANGDTIEWKVENGKLVEYKNGVKTGNTLDLAANGAVTATWDGETLTLYGVVLEDGTVGSCVISNDTDMITSISFVDSYDGWALSYVDGSWMRTDARQLFYYGSGYYRNFPTVVEKENVFGKGMANAITFEEGKQTVKEQSLVVRVTPANAKLNKEDICFVNSLGITFDDIKATKIETYDKLITKGQSAAGLYTISFKPEMVKPTFWDYAVVWYGDGPDDYEFVNYAIKAKEAVSTFDVSLGAYDFVGDDYLDLMVGGIGDEYSIDLLNNRYKGTYTNDNPSLMYGGDTPYRDLKWNDNGPNAKYPTPWTKTLKDEDGNAANYEVDVDDNRGTLRTYQAELNKAIPIYAVSYDYNIDSWVPNENVKAMYVTFDFEKCAVESAPSEWNAWKSYEAKIEGLNTVVESNAISITIKDPKANGDVIGFRVYAVNQDGTLLDPDGRAFYVQVGESANELNAINTTMSTLEDYKNFHTAITDAAFTKVSGPDTYSFTMDDPNAPEFELALLNKKEKQIGYIAANSNGAVDPAWALDGDCAIAKAFGQPIYPLWIYEDGKTYTGTFTVYNDKGRVLLVRKVTFTKILPTEVPAGYSVKTNQIDSKGNYNCFLVPSIWEAVDEGAPAGQLGTMEMNSVFNFPEGEDVNYDICFAASSYNAADKKDEDLWTTGDSYIEIEHLEYIDNTTKHTTTVSYNYGQISSALVQYDKDGRITGILDYMVQVDSFPTIYYCIYNDDSKLGFKWSWKSISQADYEKLFVKGYWKKDAVVPALIYEDFDGKSIPASYIEGKSGWDSKYQGTVNGGYKKSLVIKDAEFVTASGANKGLEEYYEVTVNGDNFDFTKQSGATNPVDKVASELVVYCNDMYGHEVVVSVPANVIRR